MLLWDGWLISTETDGIGDESMGIVASCYMREKRLVKAAKSPHFFLNRRLKGESWDIFLPFIEKKFQHSGSVLIARNYLRNKLLLAYCERNPAYFEMPESVFSSNFLSFWEKGGLPFSQLRINVQNHITKSKKLVK